MTVTFKLDGQEFMALNGGPIFKFSEAISLMVNCESQDEIDHFWTKLSEGGEEGPCGWLKDKFGLSWQIVPAIMAEWKKDRDTTRSERVVGGPRVEGLGGIVRDGPGPRGTERGLAGRGAHASA